MHANGNNSVQDCDTRLLGRRSHSLSQYTQCQYLKNNMIDENDFFMKLWYNQSDQHTRILLVLLVAFCASRARKFRKKSVSQSTPNALKHIEMQKKNLPLWPITRFAHSAKPKRRIAMKFWYNQSNLSSNTFTKFHQNPTHSYRDIGFNSRTDRQTDRQSRGERDR